MIFALHCIYLQQYRVKEIARLRDSNTDVQIIDITADKGRIFEGTGELYLPNGEIAVTAHGKYLKMTVDKITDSNFDSSGEWGIIEDEPMPERILIG